MSNAQEDTAKIGRKEKWTEEAIGASFARYVSEHKHTPTATEIDACGYLPSSRQIQRKYPGGLPALREKLGIKGPLDFTKGESGSRRAIVTQERGYKVEDEVYRMLVSRFGEMAVHREYFFTDDRRSRADFYVYDSKHGFCIDVFFAKDLRNVQGCLNIKLKKYINMNGQMARSPVIFLQANKDHDQSTLDELIANKREPLPVNCKLMSMETFAGFISGKKPRI